MKCGPSFEVTRGPEWLAELLYCQDANLVTFTFIAAVVIFGYTLYTLDITDDEQQAMLHNGGTVVSIALATLLIGELGLGYASTVAGGVLFGFVAWSVFLWPRLRK